MNFNMCYLNKLEPDAIVRGQQVQRQTSKSVLIFSLVTETTEVAGDSIFTSNLSETRDDEHPNFFAANGKLNLLSVQNNPPAYVPRMLPESLYH